VRDNELVHVPQFGQLLDVRGVLPIAEARQIAVGPCLAGVLCGGLAVHLQDPAAWLADHSAQQVQVVDLAGRGGGLGGLVETLQNRGEHPLRGPENPGRFHHRCSLHPAFRGHSLGCPGLNLVRQILEAEGVRGDVILVNPPVADHLADQAVHQRQVGARPHGQVNVGEPGHFGGTRIHAHHHWFVWPGDPVQDPGPQHRLGLGHVVAVEEDRIALVDVRVAAGLAVRAEGLLQRRRRGGRAQPGVAVHVWCAEPGFADDAQGVVLLQEQLAGGVEAVAQWSLLVQQHLAARDDPVHGGFPVGLHELPVVADQGPGQPVLVADPLPGSEESLGTEPAVVDHVHRAAPDAHHRAVLDRDVDAAAVAAQHTGRLHPPVHVLPGQPRGEDLVHPDRPQLPPGEWCAGPPNVSNPVHHGRFPFVRDSFVRVPPHRWMTG
jgi:hypothetical protein